MGCLVYAVLETAYTWTKCGLFNVHKTWNILDVIPMCSLQHTRSLRYVMRRVWYVQCTYIMLEISLMWTQFALFKWAWKYLYENLISQTAMYKQERYIWQVWEKVEIITGELNMLCSMWEELEKSYRGTQSLNNVSTGKVHDRFEKRCKS